MAVLSYGITSHCPGPMNWSFCFVPDFILGTVHKAKGLEFDTVVVTDDFSKVPCSRHNLRCICDFSIGMFLWKDPLTLYCGFLVHFLVSRFLGHIWVKQHLFTTACYLWDLGVSCSLVKSWELNVKESWLWRQSEQRSISESFSSLLLR